MLLQYPDHRNPHENPLPPLLLTHFTNLKSLHSFIPLSNQITLSTLSIPSLSRFALAYSISPSRPHKRRSLRPLLHSLPLSPFEGSRPSPSLLFPAPPPRMFKFASLLVAMLAIALADTNVTVCVGDPRGSPGNPLGSWIPYRNPTTFQDSTPSPAAAVVVDAASNATSNVSVRYRPPPP